MKAPRVENADETLESGRRFHNRVLAQLKPRVPAGRLTLQGGEAGPDLEAQTDAELVRRCLAGDQSACARLVSAHARVAGTVIWRVVRQRELVEDLCQEAFLKVFRALGSFDGRARLSTWICSIAHHVALDELRRRGRTVQFTVEEGAEQQDGGGDALDQILADEQAQRLHAALDTLPERYRLPLAYAALQELGYEDIAVILGIPVGTVKTLVFRGKAMLRERLQAGTPAVQEGQR